MLQLEVFGEGCAPEAVLRLCKSCLTFSQGLGLWHSLKGERGLEGNEACSWLLVAFGLLDESFAGIGDGRVSEYVCFRDGDDVQSD